MIPRMVRTYEYAFYIRGYAKGVVGLYAFPILLDVEIVGHGDMGNLGVGRW